MEDVSLKYRNKFLKNQLSFARKYKGIFDKVADDFAALSNNPNARFTRAFTFPKNINKLIVDITKDFHDKTLRLTEDEITNAWNFSNAKNDEIINGYLSTLTKIKDLQTAPYLMPNVPALQAFIARDNGTGTLSDTIWKVAKQMRGEMETNLGLGIANGDSAHVISQRIRRNLNNPDALFRRVRNEKGNLVPSKAMSEYHPGQGNYKSAYKNALRVARTETNQAYLLSDHIRWNQLDMVKGVKVSLSAQHHIKDICDDCQGVYPKSFVFTGWHSQCMCHATPELMPESEFLEYLDTGIMKRGDDVKIYPQGFENHLRANFERYSKYKNTPYWMKDNKKVVTSIMKGQSAAIHIRTTGMWANVAKKAISQKPPVSVNITKDPVKDIILKKEDVIHKNKSFETAVVYDNKGNLIFEKQGQQRSVSFTPADLALFKDKILTHNHPSGWNSPKGSFGRIGNSFSPQDITLSIKNDLAEVRAVTPLMRFSMKRPASGWPDLQDAIRDINRLNTEVSVEFYARIYGGTLTQNQASSVHFHTIWKRFAEKYNIEYTKSGK